MAQWMPLSRIASLSWICCDEKRPFLRNSTFTSSSTMPMASSRTLKRTDTIFSLLCFWRAKVSKIFEKSTLLQLCYD